MWPKHVMMISPEFFDIAYAINPHMIDKSGQLKQVDKNRAVRQWNDLKDKFESLGIKVSVLAGQENLPDMVFCANPIFPFLKNNQMQFICSNMHSPFRRAEVEYVASHLSHNNYEVYKLPDAFRFEGMGDAIWNYDTGEIFGGYGFRTEKSAYSHIEDITGASVIRLQLINEDYYHLDTALGILDQSTAVVVPGAFSEESLDTLRAKFKNIIWTTPSEAHDFLAANICSVDGQNVLVEKNAIHLQSELTRLGYTTHAIDTSEYIKSGGSIFCLKLQMWNSVDSLQTSVSN